MPSKPKPEPKTWRCPPCGQDNPVKGGDPCPGCGNNPPTCGWADAPVKRKRRKAA